MRQPWFQLKSDEGEDLAPVLLGFAEMIGLEQVASGRYSVLLLLELFASYQSRRLSPDKVVREIASLENASGQSITKDETLFKHLPLKGLWHKHYFADSMTTMAMNIQNEVKRNGIPWLDEQVAESQASGEERFLTVQDCDDCARCRHGKLVDLRAATDYGALADSSTVSTTACTRMQKKLTTS
jgi:hypothetical protein